VQPAIRARIMTHVSVEHQMSRSTSSDTGSSALSHQQSQPLRRLNYNGALMSLQKNLHAADRRIRRRAVLQPLRRAMFPGEPGPM